jgi:hypothetical protein
MDNCVLSIDMAVQSLSCGFTGKGLLQKRILGKKLGSFALSSRTLWARCFEREALLWVYAAREIILVFGYYR